MTPAIATPAELIARLRTHGVELPGITAADIRATILERGIQEVIACTGADGKPERYLQAFERVFGEPLVEPRKRSTA